MSPEARLPLVLFALRQEIGPFLARLERREGVRLHRCRRGRWTVDGGGRCYGIVLSGPGYQNVLETLADERPSEVIHPGFAGALSDDLARLDVRVITRARHGPEVLDIPESPRACNGLASIARASIVTVPLPMGRREKRLMHEHGAADLVDMETHAAAACCVEEGIPYTGLRIVTDELDDDIHAAVRHSFDGRRFRTWPLIRGAVGDNALLRDLLRLRRQAREAAERLADVVIPVVGD